MELFRKWLPYTGCQRLHRYPARLGGNCQVTSSSSMCTSGCSKRHGIGCGGIPTAAGSPANRDPRPAQCTNTSADHVDLQRVDTTVHVGPLETLRAAVKTACRPSIPQRWSCGDHDPGTCHVDPWGKALRTSHFSESDTKMLDSGGRAQNSAAQPIGCDTQNSTIPPKLRWRSQLICS